MTHQFNYGDLCKRTGTTSPFQHGMTFIGLDPTRTGIAVVLDGTGDPIRLRLDQLSADRPVHDSVVVDGHRYVLAPEEGQS